MESLSDKTLTIIASVILITAILWPSRAICYGIQGSTNQVETFSAASYTRSISSESIVASFGAALATEVKVADKTPLPTSLAGTTVKVRDSAGAEKLAPLFFVSPSQVNYQIPAGTATGAATITITNGAGIISVGTTQIVPVALGIFSANANGKGVPAAVALRVRGNSQTYESLFRFDEARGKFVPKPLDLGPDLGNASDQVYLILYATGLHARRNSEPVNATIGAVKADVLFAGRVDDLVGVDQINVRVPRELAGRGQVNLVLDVEGAGASNLLEIEIGIPPRPRPPKVLGFNPAIGLAGEHLEINGSDFSPTASDNLVRIRGVEAPVISGTANQLVVRVPFGAETGPIAVRTPQGEAESALPLPISTSISGYVKDAINKTALPGVRVSLREQNRNKQSNAEGAFVITELPPSSQELVEIDGTTVPVYPPYPRLPYIPLPVERGRDNKLNPEVVWLRQSTGAALTFPLAGFFANPPERGPGNGFAVPASRSITTDGVTFEVPDNTTADFPGGDSSGRVVLTRIENSRTPVSFPAGVFSSAVIQLTPIGVKLTPGGKLIFPNTDNLKSSDPVRLYRLDQTLNSPTVGRFAEAGTATVSADGKLVETAPDAVKETTYFFVAAPRPTTTVIGRVVDSDGNTPVRNALVSARGRAIFTDGNGGFMLLDIALIDNTDPLNLDVSFHRPDGRVDRTERNLAATDLKANGITQVAGNIVLPAGNRPPTLIGLPSALSVTRGTPREIDFVANDPDPGQTLQLTVEGADFAAVSKVGESAYRLRLTPGTGAANSYTVMVKATDNPSLSVMEKIVLTVFDNRPPVLIVSGSQTVNSSRTLNFTVSAADPDTDTGQTLAFSVQGLPAGATFNPITRQFSWTPDFLQAGSHQVSFKVTDNGLPAANDTKEVTITVVGWAPTAGPEGGIVRTFHAAGGNLFAGVQGGVYRSSDQGQTWSPAYSGIEGANIWALASIGGDLFAGSHTDSRGVYRSTDNGQTWRAANGNSPADIPAGLNITALAVIGTTLFAGTEQGGVYQSTDRGQSWAVVPIDGLANRDINSLTAIGTTLFAGTRLPAPENGRVYRSPDQGRNWAPVDGLPNDSVRTFTSNDSYLFAGLSGSGVYRSGDNGVTWTAANTGVFPVVYALAASGTKLFAGTPQGGIYLSLDNGVSWAEANTGLKSKYVLSLAVNGVTLFAGTEGAGVFRSSDDGSNWTTSSKGLTATQINSLGVNGATIFAGARRHGLFLSADNGKTWTRPMKDIPNELICHVFAVSGMNIFAGTDGGVFHSTDNGQTWNARNNGLTSLTVQALAFSGTTLFAGTSALGQPSDGGVFRSTDNGQNWSPVNAGLNGATSRTINALTVNGSTLFAGAQSGVFRSADNGLTWTNVLPLSGFPVATLISSGAGLVAGAGSNGGLYRSRDNGDSWPTVNTGLSDRWVNALAVSGPTLFAGTNSGGVFVSVNGGDSWTPVNTGLKNTLILSLAVSGGKLLAGTAGGGVFISQ